MRVKELREFLKDLRDDVVVILMGINGAGETVDEVKYVTRYYCENGYQEDSSAEAHNVVELTSLNNYISDHDNFGDEPRWLDYDPNLVEE